MVNNKYHILLNALNIIFIFAASCICISNKMGFSVFNVDPVVLRVKKSDGGMKIVTMVSPESVNIIITSS